MITSVSAVCVVVTIQLTLTVCRLRIANRMAITRKAPIPSRRVRSVVDRCDRCFPVDSDAIRFKRIRGVG